MSMRSQHTKRSYGKAQYICHNLHSDLGLIPHEDITHTHIAMQ